MKVHSTNYFDTFIEVSADTKAGSGIRPPSKERKTVAEIQYRLIFDNPYRFTSDDVLFEVYALKNDLTQAEYARARGAFFSKGQPCLRTSPLAKNYGFGIHCNSEGKVALFGMETEEYQQFLANTEVKKVKAMKSSK